jgi:hypothetical protein
VEQEVGGSSPPNCTTHQTNVALTDVEASMMPATKGSARPILLANPLLFTHNPKNSASGGSMFAVQSRKFQFSLMLATALSFSMLPTAGRAYTPEQQAACSDDAFRLCSADVPDVDRITACMIRNKAQLSPGCRVYFRSSGPERASELTSVNAGRPLNIKPETRPR